MSITSIFRGRRQRDPSAAAPAAAPRFADPHGIATPAKLAEIAAQAQAETARTQTMPSSAPWGPWDRPGSFPEAMAPDALRDEHGRWYGWGDTSLDNPPAHARRYAPDPLTSPLPRSPLSFAADFAELPVFRAACRAAGHAPAGRVRGGLPALPDFRIAEMMHHRFAGMLAMHPARTERAA